MQEIKTINLTSRLGGVNCYLVKTGDGDCVLIDTGYANQRARLEKELEGAGCPPGKLKLIVVTHGDSDHAGNAAFLREQYGAKIAMHRGESQAVERGNMLLSRKRWSMLSKIVFSLFGLGPADRFKPDFYVDDGDDLSKYGFDARVLYLPGHSIGSIGILTAGGDSNAPLAGPALFCGDLLTNTKEPAKNTLVDDAAELNASVERVKGMGIQTVYPGHGKPFATEALV